MARRGRPPGSRNRPKPESVDVDALTMQQRHDLELERQAYVTEAVRLANERELPKLGGELPEIERGPIDAD